MYSLAPLTGDYNSGKRDKVGKPVGRRVAGKTTGKAMRNLFK